MPQKLDLQPIEDEHLDLEPLNLEPVNEPPVESPIKQSGMPPADPGFLSSFYHKLSDPLTDIPSRVGKYLSKGMDSIPTIQSDGQGGMQDYFSGVDNRAKGFFQGATEAAGDLASSFTSLGNIGMTALTGGSNLAGKAGLSTVAKLMSYGAKAFGVPGVIHGGSELLSPDSSLQQRGQGLVELAGNVAGMTHTPNIKLKEPSTTQTIKTSSGETTVHGPASVIEQTHGPAGPTAEFAFDWPGFNEDGSPEKFYHIRGGEGDKSTVSGPELDRLGIPRPDAITLTPPPANNPNFGITPIGNDFFTRIKSQDTPTEVVPAEIPWNQDTKQTDLRGWADHEAYRQQQIDNGLPDPGPYKEGTQRPPDIEVHPTPPEGENPLFAEHYARQRARQKAIGPEQGSVVEPLGSGNEGRREFVSVGDEQPTSTTNDSLPRDLQGGKPRFNIGTTSYEPVFANDLDKALFIISQKTPSKRNADYLAYVMKVTGLDEAGAIAAGQAVRSKIKAAVSGQEGGPVQLGVLHGSDTPTAAPITPPTPPKNNLQTAPLGQTIIIRKEGATPNVIKEAKAAGFTFQGLNDQGHFRFKKTSEPVAQPILEGEVGTTRPTTSGVKEHLGPLADEKRGSNITEAFNLSRGIMAAVDFSGPLRQGIALIHKPAFWKALKPMFKAWTTEQGFRDSQNAIAQRPLFRERAGADGKILPSFADDAGLKLTDLTDLSKREEAIMSTWAEKVPGVRRSNRAYTAFLNNLRADTFESLVKDGKIFGADAKVNLPLARELAKFVNTASGRGSLGSLESSAVALNTAFFSPRLIASRVQMMNPGYYIMAAPQVRREALKSLFAIAMAGNTVTQLGKMAGGTVSMNPTSSDFGKLKIGNTRIDPYGGFQQYIVAASRLVSGKVTSSTTGNEYDLNDPQGPYDPTHADVVTRFIRGKVHPVVGFAWSLMSGKKEMSGEPMNFTTANPMENAVAQRFIPILMQDMYELAQDEDMPPALKAIVATGATFGMGQQTYGQDQ